MNPSRRTLRALALGAATLSVTLACAVPGTAAADASSTSPSGSASITTASRKASDATLRVASFNVRNANTNTHKRNEKSWASRRGTVVSQIKGQDLDVIGIQEATQGRLHGSDESRNISQFDDLRNRLGGSWKVTNSARYNCVNSASPNHCRYRYQGASGGNRILYDAGRVTMLAQGSKKLSSPKGSETYMAWAAFRQNSTGKTFMFSDLHTVSSDKYHSYKKKQAAQAAAELKKHRVPGASMIAVGDWNSSRFERPSNGPYDAYRSAGFVDPLGQKYRSTTTAPGATVQHRIRTWLNSSNSGWARKAPAHRDWKNGSYIDYIMTTKMAVKEWETVARLDSKGRYVGTLPSDHNMIRASVVLP